MGRDHVQGDAMGDQWMVPKPAPNSAMTALTVPLGRSTQRMANAGSGKL